ncbi:serine/threonine-protein kinase [Anaeromyxobacter paludicola]|uniref:Protein kinase domain-containing protein n=1 Tax=Anaeromyxobacter paludicola TaxID=2918171 RepID=A0ABN6N1V3_9BACT|nr:serine/threonine-protein kinase [Anaeromyxobacter paludicola]BDG07148.1 hypothetical protein AMPC_02610 [Anaeromyxobacter paludicola]
MPGTFGKYRVVAPLASGGMADVYRAELPGPGGFVKEVALKVVRGGGDAAAVAMFVQEARLASRLGHANIVQVLDFGREGDRWFIAMELVRGHSLRQVVERCRAEGVRFGLPRAVQVGIEVARALAYAHRLREEGRPAGLVHRDVSPQNVLVSFEGEVKLADFGIARAVSAGELTAPGTLKGKLAYMAPEQARAEPVDGRADVFALGVVLWELCAGRRLFARDGDAATLAAVTSGEPISRPSEWNELVPPALDEAIASALARDPARRTGSAEALERELAEVRHAQGWRPEDVDLRPLMRRLFPDGAAGPTLPRARRAEAEPEAPGGRERTAVMPAARRGGGEPAAAAPAEPTEAPTLTLADRRRPRAALLAAGALVALGAAGLGWRALAPGRRRADLPRPAGSAAVASPPSAEPTRPEPTPAAAATAVTGASPEPTAVAAPGPDAAAAVAAPRPSSAPATSPAAPPALVPASPPAATDRDPATLTVNAWPWATVHVDGEVVGETPRQLRLAPGRHRIELTHPRLPSVVRELELAPGARRTWSATLKR